MLVGWLILVGCWLLGEMLVFAAALPMPGAVVGMALLFLFLLWRREVNPPLQQAAQSLLQYFGLLFVPAGVGIILHLERITQEWLPIGIALTVGTWGSIAITAWVLQRLANKERTQDVA